MRARASSKGSRRLRVDRWGISITKQAEQRFDGTRAPHSTTWLCRRVKLMAGAVEGEGERENSPRLRRFPRIFSRSPPIPDADLPSFRYTPDRLEMHVQTHGRHPRWVRLLCAASSRACWFRSRSHGSPSTLRMIKFVACAIPLPLGLPTGMLCATELDARARHRNATLFPRLVRGPPFNLSTYPHRETTSLTLPLR